MPQAPCSWEDPRERLSFAFSLFSYVCIVAKRGVVFCEAKRNIVLQYPWVGRVGFMEELPYQI